MYKKRLAQQKCGKLRKKIVAITEEQKTEPITQKNE